jgi:hypothetical protein
MSMKDTKSPKPVSPDQLTTFCYMVMEEFLMKKNMVDTLDAFRNEWTTRPDDVRSVCIG